MTRMLHPMRITLAGLLLLSGAAMAQSWPNETGLGRDAFRSSIDQLDRFRSNDQPRLQGEDVRERVGGWAGAVRGWLEQQGEKIGQNESDSAR